MTGCVDWWAVYPSWCNLAAQYLMDGTDGQTVKTKKTIAVHHHTHTHQIPPLTPHLSKSLGSLLSLVNHLYYLYPYSLSAFMAASHTISCSPALFADGRDERDGAGWLLGYWALSTNGRPRQGRFHAPPSRRQPSEQHSHLSTLFLPPTPPQTHMFYLFLISICWNWSDSLRDDLLATGFRVWFFNGFGIWVSEN